MASTAAIKKAKDAIMQALADLLVMNKTQPPLDRVAAKAGYKGTEGKAFRGAVKELNADGIITKSKGIVELTEAGKKDLPEANAPPTNADVQAKQLEEILKGKKLPKEDKTKQIFGKLQDGLFHNKKQLALDAGYAGADSGGFKSLMKRMKELGLLEDGKKGTTRLSEDCFPCGRTAGGGETITTEKEDTKKPPAKKASKKEEDDKTTRKDGGNKEKRPSAKKANKKKSDDSKGRGESNQSAPPAASTKSGVVLGDMKASQKKASKTQKKKNNDDDKKKVKDSKPSGKSKRQDAAKKPAGKGSNKKSSSDEADDLVPGAEEPTEKNEIEMEDKETVDTKENGKSSDGAEKVNEDEAETTDGDDSGESSSEATNGDDGGDDSWESEDEKPEVNLKRKGSKSKDGESAPKKQKKNDNE